MIFLLLLFLLFQKHGSSSCCCSSCPLAPPPPPFSSSSSSSFTFFLFLISHARRLQTQPCLSQMLDRPAASATKSFTLQHGVHLTADAVLRLSFPRPQMSCLNNSPLKHRRLLSGREPQTCGSPPKRLFCFVSCITIE